MNLSELIKKNNEEIEKMFLASEVYGLDGMKGYSPSGFCGCMEGDMDDRCDGAVQTLLDTNKKSTQSLLSNILEYIEEYYRNKWHYYGNGKTEEERLVAVEVLKEVKDYIKSDNK